MKHVRITALLMAISDTGLAESGHSTAAGACKERNARGRSTVSFIPKPSLPMPNC
jgi:hypothetical protein